MGYKEAIQNALVTAGAAGTFKEATYTTARPSLLVSGATVTPAFVEANEVRAAYGIDDRFGREYRQERQGWAWLMILRFNTEVILEEFEQALLESPLVVARDPGNGVNLQVRLLLEDSAYEHPPRGGASNGTQVTYRFVAELCPQ